VEKKKGLKTRWEEGTVRGQDQAGSLLRSGGKQGGAGGGSTGDPLAKRWPWETVFL